MTAQRVEPGFEPVQAAFEEVISKQPGTGAALAVWRDGGWLIDVWGGMADAAGSRAWGRDSIVQPYSVSKPFAAVCALLLVQRGDLDLDAPVQRYWPEFTAQTTARQVLSHQAGVIALDEPAPTEVLFDWEEMCRRLAAQRPLWEPGTAVGESALFYGHLVDELVRRIDGRRLGAFLRDEVTRPLGLDFAFGLDRDDQLRAVELTGVDEFFRAAVADATELYRRATDNPPGVHIGSVVNSEPWRAAEVPAVNGHGTARGVAGFYVALLEQRLLTPGLLEEATSVQASGIDQVFGEQAAFGLGFGVDGDGFGMGGIGGSYAGVNRDGYVIAFLTGSMGTHDRVSHLENTFRRCVGLPELAA
jgi:CubicO group peptidase (beta-lactamase class C family)